MRACEFDQMELCAVKQQRLWWACMHHRAGICKHKSHEMSCSAQYRTLCGCLIFMSLVDATLAYALRQLLVCENPEQG